MRSKVLALGPFKAAAAITVLLVLFPSGCRAPGTGAGTTPVPSSDATLADRLEKLPALPAEIAATLDPKTHATKAGGPRPTPVKATGPLPHAPCCSIKNEKSLKVKVALTKCGPLRDFIVASVLDLVVALEGGAGGGTSVTPTGPAGALGSAGNVRAYKLDTVNRTRPWDTWVCMTSDGPWDAIFTEEHNCVNYGSQDTLVVSGWGGLVLYAWNGGPAGHPAEVTVVSCSDLGTTRLPCGGLSTCDCTSSPCQAQPCPSCSPPW
jgi:hypothetical protein